MEQSRTKSVLAMYIESPFRKVGAKSMQSCFRSASDWTTTQR